MLHTTVVLGPTRSGKSSMIAAAILHAARLKAQGRRIRCNGSQSPSSLEQASQGGRRKQYRLIENEGAGFWRQDETLRIGSVDDLDHHAQRLWLRWLRAEQDPGASVAAVPVGAEFAVTEIGASLLGFDSSSSPRRLCFVEVSNELFQGLGGGKTRLRGRVATLAEQRLSAALRHADVVTLCFAATDVWSRVDLAAYQHILSECHRLRPRNAITNLAVNKVEVFLAERIYRERRIGIEPGPLSSERYAREIVRARFQEDGLFAQTKETSGLRMRIASSFGWLTASGSFNVDLVHQSRPLTPSPEPLCLHPLWPQRGANLKHLVPSNPQRLRHWRPIGVLEALLDCEVPAERSASRWVAAGS